MGYEKELEGEDVDSRSIVNLTSWAFYTLALIASFETGASIRETARVDNGVFYVMGYHVP